MNRSMRGRKRSRGGNAGPPRRVPPPEATGLEGQSLESMKRAATRLLIRLRDGSAVQGTIEYHDRETIKIRRAQGPHVFLRKTDIRYLQPD